MSRRPLGGALTAGLILIIIGAIFLIENLYAPFSAWRLIARYWPVILIFIGLRRMYDYFTWPQNPPAPNRPESKE
jgi:putative Mn2+ efflux pump MntP